MRQLLAPSGSGCEKSTFMAAAMPRMLSLPCILHFSHPTQSMRRVMLWNAICVTCGTWVD